MNTIICERVVRNGYDLRRRTFDTRADIEVLPLNLDGTFAVGRPMTRCLWVAAEGLFLAHFTAPPMVSGLDAGGELLFG